MAPTPLPRFVEREIGRCGDTTYFGNGHGNSLSAGVDGMFYGGLLSVGTGNRVVRDCCSCVEVDLTHLRTELLFKEQGFNFWLFDGVCMFTDGIDLGDIFEKKAELW
jgi:hypothetical protein